MCPYVCTVHVKKNATICKVCALLFEKKRATLLRFSFGFVRETLENGIPALFAKRTAIRRMCRIFTGCQAFVPQKALQSLNCGILQDGALSGIAACLQGRRRTFMDYGALARRDSTLLRKMAHLRERCGIAAKYAQLQHSHQSVAQTVGEKWHALRRVFNCGYGAFVAFFLTRNHSLIMTSDKNIFCLKKFSQGVYRYGDAKIYSRQEYYGFRILN